MENLSGDFLTKLDMNKGHSFRDQDGIDISFFDWMLMETEKLHSQVRRYTSPEEHPFHPSAIIKHSKLPQLNYPVTINNDIKEKVNVNAIVKSAYIKSIIPRLW
jgi:chorismate mutase